MSGNNMHSASTPQQELCDAVAGNLKKLIERNGLTQRELAELVGVAPATMTDYCRGRRLPTVEFLVELKKRYGISIDEFLTQSIPAGDSSFGETDEHALTTYRKYCGIYYVYYFDTSKLKGRDSLNSRESLLYGILCIYETRSLIGRPRYNCAAILGFHDRINAASVKAKLEGMDDPSQMVEYIDREYEKTAYYGDFEMSQEHAFISMTHANTDKALLILHRVDNNKKNYTGGIGTINSISKGRERMPVIQFMGISRHALSLSTEEVHHRLLLNYPAFSAGEETDGMIKTFKNLYMTQDEPSRGFTDYQKFVMVQSTLEWYIRKILERNMFRYGKISEQDDDDWYHCIKDVPADEGGE